MDTRRKILFGILAFIAGGALLGVLVTVLPEHVFGSFDIRIPFITKDTPATLEADTSTPASTVIESTPDIGVRIHPFTRVRAELLAAHTAFIEVDISDRKIYFYDETGAQTVTPVRSTGDPQGWGGTPAGLYTVLSKNKLAFSASAEAYMPDAIHFYGKYFLHGEPYYPDGQKINSNVSGGCVQIGDEHTAQLFANAKVGMPVLVIDTPYDTFEYPRGANLSIPNISAKSYLVADLDSGEILAEKNATAAHSIASITKLMTTVVVAEHTDLRKSITASSDSVERGFSGTGGLNVGGSYRLVELLYPLLIESSNDAAEVLTGFLGRDKTIRLMNEKADSLFMSATEYVDPSGYSDENVSTAHDLYLLGRYINNNRKPMFEITKGQKVTTFGPVRFSTTSLWNKNEFQGDPDFIGGKTGYITASRYTGLFLFRTLVKGEEREIAVVVLKSESLKSDTQALKQWVEENYR